MVDLDINWSEIYPDAVEDIPPVMSYTKVKNIMITIFVDEDHTHNTKTRLSVTGVLTSLNKTLTQWYSRHYDTVETSTYVSELMAMIISTELTMVM